MSMNRFAWRTLVDFYLRSPELFMLVTSWVDDANPSEYITRWDQRFFLDRLVRRAFKELSDTKYYPGVEDVILQGEMGSISRYRRKATTYVRFPSQYHMVTCSAAKARKVESTLVKPSWLKYQYSWCEIDDLIARSFEKQAETSAF